MAAAMSFIFFRPGPAFRILVLVLRAGCWMGMLVAFAVMVATVACTYTVLLTLAGISWVM